MPTFVGMTNQEMACWIPHSGESRNPVPENGHAPNVPSSYPGTGSALLRLVLYSPWENVYATLCFTSLHACAKEYITP